MADNVNITAGSGTPIATDDEAGVHYQKVKLVDGTSGQTTPIPGDGNGLYTQVRQVLRLAQYRAAHTSAFTAPASGNTPFFVITGSASKTIRVKRIVVSGISQAAIAFITILLQKYSTAPSGGTATALTETPLDSNDSGSTANLCQVYTVAPTPGTLVGNIASRRTIAEDTVPVAGAPTPPTIEFDLRALGDDRGGVVLRGTAQGLGLALNLAVATTLSVEVEWSEE